MRRTLFFIPNEIAGWPVFGPGWALLLWLLIGGGVLAVSVRRAGWSRETLGQLPMILLVAAIILLVLPQVEVPIEGQQLTIPPVHAVRGLPVRGYGVMLLLAVVSGVWLATIRAKRAGLGTDAIMGLAFVMVIGGLVGARLFFVVQYWQRLQGADWRETLANLFSIEKGGLVVYGSLVGAASALLLYCRRNRFPVLPLADLIAPSLALGLAWGRIGCLLNGCCFGGPCDHNRYPWAVTFPADSPPYLDQKGWGTFYGLQLGENARREVVVLKIDPHGPLAATALRVGDQLVAVDGRTVDGLEAARYRFEQAGSELTLTTSRGRTITAGVDHLPARSNPVHPTQVYSSINALLLCLLTLAIYPFRRRHGQVIALLLSLYAVTRFLLELIRSDEAGVLADLTIAQTISILVAIAMVALWIYVQRQPPLECCPTRRSPTQRSQNGRSRTRQSLADSQPNSP